MSVHRRRPWTAALAAATALAASLAACLVPGSAVARDLAVRALDMGRYGRIILEFDAPTKVAARAANGVLVMSFGAPVTIKAERLAAELPPYVSVVRRDPDRTGLRLALTANWRPNVTEAGEKVFVDLLPPDWTGLPPPLPPEVVAELARRAREAEAKLKEENRRKREAAVKPLAISVVKLPTLTRLVFEAETATPVSFRQSGPSVELVFEGAFTLNTADARGRLDPVATDLRAETEPGSLRVSFSVAQGHQARGFREDDNYVVDIEAPPAPAPPPVVAKPAVPTPPAVVRAPEASARPAQAAEAPAGTSTSGASGRPAEAAVAAPGPVRPVATLGPDGLKVHFPFKGRTPAAAFERAGVATLVFHTLDTLEQPVWPPGAERFATLREVAREGAFAVMRVDIPSGGGELLRLAPEGNGWVLALGDARVGGASEPLGVRRGADADGRTVVTVGLAGGSGVHWLADAGAERIAVVTALGPPRAAVKPQRFVEFRLLQTAHGLAVVAEAEDVTVRSGEDGVTVARGSGLAVSLPAAGGEMGLGGGSTPSLPPVIQRERWLADQRGDVLGGQRALLRAVAEAPRLGRSAARLDLARHLLASGLGLEAKGVLDFAVAEDPGLAAQRPVLILRAIAAARAHRDAEARRHLAHDSLVEDPEAVLWRAALDGRARRWTPALVGFRRAAPVLELYPDDLQAELRLIAARAGIEQREFAFADAELAAVDQLHGETVPREAMRYWRARLDEATGRPDVALDVYRQLASSDDRGVAAEATLRFAGLGLDLKALGSEEAVARLETVSTLWRGDDVEIGALGRLGRLYAQAGRWRDAFLAARRANRIFPDHPVTRVLHDETARLFEELFIEDRSESLSRIDALALYFDFKEFTPIGRRGDEIVRRLADRLVGLDLLDQAGDLLEHQVGQRLDGAAKATVAARLATVRLMAGKPLQALEAVQTTRLPELPAAIKRARLLLEARALSDLTRTDLALEVLQGEAGPEIDRLRADVLWTGRRWREAGEAHESLVGARWRDEAPLVSEARADIMRAAVAYALGDEALALDRLRAKFAAKMADSEDARTFALLTQPNATATRAFRDVARGMTSAETLSEFLAEYRKRYPEASAPERPRRQPSAPAQAAGSPPAAPG